MQAPSDVTFVATQASERSRPAYRWLRTMGIVEGFSFLLLLFVAMPLKYMAGMPEAVRWIGSIHGALFVLYCLLLAIAGVVLKWSISKLVLGFFAGVFPFGFLWFEKHHG